MVDKKRIKQFIKISCIIQSLNALMDAILWFTLGFQVPSWTISTLVVGYSVILIAYDRVYPKYTVNSTPACNTNFLKTLFHSLNSVKKHPTITKIFLIAD